MCHAPRYVDGGILILNVSDDQMGLAAPRDVLERATGSPFIVSTTYGFELSCPEAGANLCASMIST